MFPMDNGVNRDGEQPLRYDTSGRRRPIATRLTHVRDRPTV
jgi:hypothetical protein